MWRFWITSGGSNEFKALWQMVGTSLGIIRRGVRFRYRAINAFSRRVAPSHCHLLRHKSHLLHHHPPTSLRSLKRLCTRYQPAFWLAAELTEFYAKCVGRHIRSIMDLHILWWWRFPPRPPGTVKQALLKRRRSNHAIVSSEMVMMCAKAVASSSAARARDAFEMRFNSRQRSDLIVSMRCLWWSPVAIGQAVCCYFMGNCPLTADRNFNSWTACTPRMARYKDHVYESRRLYDECLDGWPPEKIGRRELRQ